jgi:hypothetical protein
VEEEIDYMIVCADTTATVLKHAEEKGWQPE